MTKAAAKQTPGNVRIPATRRQPSTTNNYTDRRVLLRLKEGSSFFEKQSFQIRLAFQDKLALKPQDIHEIKSTNTGWSVQARNEEIQNKIIESQGIWGPIMDLDIAEKHVVWHTYIIDDFPNEISSYDGSILDFEKTISEEIIAQTGQTPVQWRRSSKPGPDPTKTSLIISFEKAVHRDFRLLGAGRPSRPLPKTKKLTQCPNCWMFHAPVRCTAAKSCRTCGTTDPDHDVNGCQAAPRCSNCHGPHPADSESCYARPKKVGNSFQKLSKSQRIHARKLGANDYRRQHKENLTQTLDNRATPTREPGTAENAEVPGTEMAAEEDEEMGDAMHSTETHTDNHGTGAHEEARDRMDTQEEQHQANEDEQALVGNDKNDGMSEEGGTDSGQSDSDDDVNADADSDVDTDAEADANAAGEACHGNAELETQQSSDKSSQEDGAGRNAENHTITEQRSRSDNNTQPPATEAITSENSGNIRDRPAQHMTTIKKRFLTTHAARQIIPSDDTNVSSDPLVCESINVRTSRERSPPSSPPQETRRRDQSPKKRLRRNMRTYSK